MERDSRSTAQKRTLVVGLAVVAIWLTWMWMRDVDNPQVNDSFEKSLQSAEAFPATHEDGTQSIERSAVPLDASAKDSYGLVTVEILAVSAADRSRLPGMKVSLIRPGDEGSVLSLGSAITGVDGLASLQVPHGKVAVVVSDSTGAWVMEGAWRRPLIIDAPCSQVIARMVPRFEGLFKFVGGKARSVGAGEIQGFNLDNSLQADGNKVRPIAAEGGVYRLALIPKLPIPQGEAWVPIEVVGTEVGECIFSIPVRRVGQGAEPYACDLSTANASPLVSVTVDVVDLHGRQVEIPVSLGVPKRITEVALSGQAVRVPTGHRYVASLGDPFPIHWLCATPSAEAQLDLRGSTTSSVQVDIALPVAIAHKNLRVLVDGLAIPNPAKAVIRAVGSWGSVKSCFGVGCPGVSLDRALSSRIPLPIGKVVFELETESLSWRKEVLVDDGADLLIDLTSAEGVPR